MRRTRFLAVLVSTLSISIICNYAPAAQYPDKPVRLVVTAAPGGANDYIAPALQPGLSEDLTQPVVVDNREGAGGIVGAEVVAKSAPDGYTLLVTFVNFSIYPSLNSNLSFDPIKDFAPISNLASQPLMLVANQKVPAKNVAELIDLSKKQGGLAYASPGTGSLGHLAAELFITMTGANLRHVPYKGGGPSLMATIVGDVQMFFSAMPSALVQINAGRLRGLAVTSAKRSSAIPNVPTMAESGVAGYEVTGWTGLLAPARTPTAIITKVHKSFVKALSAPDISAQFEKDGIDLNGNTPEEFAKLLKSDIENGRALSGVQVSRISRNSGFWYMC